MGLAVSTLSGPGRTVPSGVGVPVLGCHLGTAKAGSVQPIIDIAIAHARDGFAVNLVTDNPQRFDWKLRRGSAWPGIDAVGNGSGSTCYQMTTSARRSELLCSRRRRSWHLRSSPRRRTVIGILRVPCSGAAISAEARCAML